MGDEDEGNDDETSRANNTSKVVSFGEFQISKMADPIWPPFGNQDVISKLMTSSLPRKYLSMYYLFNKSHSLPGTLVILKTAFLINKRENLISGC